MGLSVALLPFTPPGRVVRAVQRLRAVHHKLEVEDDTLVPHEEAALRPPASGHSLPPTMAALPQAVVALRPPRPVPEVAPEEEEEEEAEAAHCPLPVCCPAVAPPRDAVA